MRFNSMARWDNSTWSLGLISFRSLARSRWYSSSLEICVNRLKDLGLNKGLENLNALRQKLVAVTDRLAGFEADLLNVHVDFPLFQYIHSLWHDVTVRTSEEHLPAQWLRRRLEFLARWFPPDRGHRLFPGRR